MNRWSKFSCRTSNQTWPRLYIPSINISFVLIMNVSNFWLSFKTMSFLILLRSRGFQFCSTCKQKFVSKNNGVLPNRGRLNQTIQLRHCEWTSEKLPAKWTNCAHQTSSAGQKSWNPKVQPHKLRSTCAEHDMLVQGSTHRSATRFVTHALPVTVWHLSSGDCSKHGGNCNVL